MVCLTVDVEGDCPPYLATFRGIEEGMERLLGLLAEESVRATFFVTGSIAGSHPEAIRTIVSQGHELGSHGMNHRDFTRLDKVTATEEIRRSRERLQDFAPVDSFRAPYLRFPDPYLPLLAEAGFTIDSSQAKYKWASHRRQPRSSLIRIPVSMTSSVLRLPDWVRLSILNALASPVVLFVHPWEFVDLTREKLRLDCRFRTGIPAVGCLRSAIGFFKAKGARFYTLREAGSQAGAGLKK
jgi:peptidoglycan-N-acetylglucosamine deacetylase